MSYVHLEKPTSLIDVVLPRPFPVNDASRLAVKLSDLDLSRYPVRWLVATDPEHGNLYFTTAFEFDHEDPRERPEQFRAWQEASYGVVGKLRDKGIVDSRAVLCGFKPNSEYLAVTFYDLSLFNEAKLDQILSKRPVQRWLPGFPQLDNYLQRDN